MRLRFAFLLSALAPFAWSAQALAAFGVGIEGGATATYASNVPGGASGTAGSANVGLILESKFDLPVVFLDVWVDGQTPMRLQTGGTSAAQYLPFDLGLRLGLGTPILQPYIGVLGQLSINTDDGGGPSLKNPLFGLGGDVGLDVAFLIFRVGIEVRAVDVVTTIPNDGSGEPSGAWEFEGLGSARLSF